MITGREVGEIQDGSGFTYLLSMCMTRTSDDSQEEESLQICGEYWFLVPPVTAVLDTSRPDHQVLLLVDKEKYDFQNEVIVYIPTSHVLLHEADMLSLQLLHDSDDHDDEVNDGRDLCWHHKPSARVIHTQVLNH